MTTGSNKSQSLFLNYHLKEKVQSKPENSYEVILLKKSLAKFQISNFSSDSFGPSELDVFIGCSFGYICSELFFTSCTKLVDAHK